MNEALGRGRRSVRKTAFVVLAFGLILAACATYPSGSQGTTETCRVFFRHYDLKQIEMAAREGQRSGDAELAREATQLEEDLAQRYVGVPALVDIVRMTDRCRKLGFS